LTNQDEMVSFLRKTQQKRTQAQLPFGSYKLLESYVNGLSKIVYDSHSDCTTGPIRVEAVSRYLDAIYDESKEVRFRFMYRIKISNVAATTESASYRLLSRKWHVCMPSGREEIYEGEGVVGQNPELSSGGSFLYESHTMIHSLCGSMHGYYQFWSSEGRPLQIRIAPFGLLAPEDVVLTLNSVLQKKIPTIK